MKQLTKTLSWLGPVQHCCTVLLLVSCWFSSLSILASQAAGQRSGNVSLDLSSGTASIAGGTALGKISSVAIKVGGNAMIVTPDTMLTPAEYLAVLQVVSAGRQSLVVNNSGIASGGSFSTNAVSSGIGNLVIPSGVTALDNFAVTPKLNLSGDFINSGTYYAYSNSRGNNSATISANNIINGQGASISSMLPSDLLSSLNGISSLNLILQATNNIINHGTISSSGDLSMSAGTSITNTSIGNTMALISGNSVTMSAASITNAGQITALTHDLNITTNMLSNAAMLQALQGSLSISSLTGTSLQILNEGGLLAARDLLSLGISGSASTNNNITITGGTLQSASLSISAKQGSIAASVVDITNDVSLDANSFDLSVSNGTQGLTLQKVPSLQSGALTYSGAGDVSFHGMNTSGSNIDVATTGTITVLAQGNSSQLGDINTSVTRGNGGYVSLRAGQSVSVGNITTAGGINGNGGDITLAAGTTVTAGNLNASGGANSGAAGKISLSAGSNAAGAITTGSITDAGTPGGAVLVSTPGTLVLNGNLSAPGGTVSLTTGGNNIAGSIDVTGGSVSLQGGDDEGEYKINFSDIAKFAGSDVSIGNSNGYSADIVLNSDCNGCLGSINSLAFSTSGHFIGTGHSIQLSANTEFSVKADAGINTGSVSGAKNIAFQTVGALVVDGDLNSPGAVTLIADSNGAGNQLSVSAGQQLTGTSVTLATGKGDISIQNSSLAANGGNILVNAGGNVNIQGGQFRSAQTPGNTGGQIAINAGASTTDLSSLLAALQTQRNGSEIVSVSGGSLDSSNHVNSTGGSILKVVFPDGGTKSITNTTFNMSGGVIYVDPPAGNNVTINGATFSASGTPVTGGGNGGGGNGGGGTGGGGTGSTGSAGGASGGTLSFTDSSSANQSVTSISTTLQEFSTSNITITNGRDALGELGSDNAAAVLPPDASPANSLEGTGFRPLILCSPAGTLNENESVDSSSWIMATNKCQPFSFESPDGTIIIGSGPATFAPAAHRTLLLKEGKLLVVAGENIIVVRTPLCDITVPINSAITIEYSPDGLARLTSLAGGKASVSITRHGESMILSAAPGEQLVFAAAALPESAISCQPAVANKKVNTWMIQLDDVRGNKFTFDRAEMVAQEGLLNCTLGCFSKPQQAMIDQIRKSMLIENPKELKSMRPVKPTIQTASNSSAAMFLARASAFNPNHLQAVSFGRSVDLEVPDVTIAQAHTATMRYVDAVVAIDGPNKINLKRGDMLITTTAPTAVAAGTYSLNLAGGTIALVSNRGDHLIVRNLYENKTAAVMVRTPDNKAAAVQVGQELIVGRAGLSYTRVLGEDAVGRRRMRHYDLGNASNVIASEVSLVSLIQNTDVLGELTRSSNPEDKALIAKIEKMAVALSLITQSHGNYSMVGQ